MDSACPLEAEHTALWPGYGAWNLDDLILAWLLHANLILLRFEDIVFFTN